MKYLISLLLITVAFSEIASAQKVELINSGDVIKSSSTLSDSGKYKGALLQLNKVNRSDTNYVWSLYEKALNCEADSQYAQAVKYCEEGLALKEQREYEADIYNTLGNTLNEWGQPEKALKIFDAAIAKYPNYSLLYFNKGVVFLALNKPHEAELLFQKTLLINPYLYSAHFQMSIAALRQGKVIPAFLSLVGYLLMIPEGKYWSKSINLLGEIGKGNDEVLAFKNKRTDQQDANFQEVEDILLSKIALDKGYKPIIPIDDPVCRQIQAVFEKLEYKEDDNDFYMQYYVPYFKNVFNNGKFEPFIHHIFANVKVDIIQDYDKRKKKELQDVINDAADYFNNIRATRQLTLKKRDTVANKYYFENGNVVGKGLLVNNGKTLNGRWEFYYPDGSLKSVGSYNTAGQTEGEWIFYFRSGHLKAKEHSVNGKLQGAQQYYFDNGNASSLENYSNGQLEGLTTAYYYAGAIRSATNYKAGKKNGEQKEYYSNGSLQTISSFANGSLSGTVRQYYKNGQLKDVEQYVDGKGEGPYKSYFDNGAPKTVGQYTKDSAEGEFTYYGSNGKKEEKHIYVNGLEEGVHEEYYETEQVSASYPSKKGKINGEYVGYDKDGKVFSKYVYDNGIIKSGKYFDKSGAVLSSAEKIDDVFNIVTYTPDGHKKAHLYYNKKGDLDGTDTVFFASGKIYELSYYKDGEVNGNSVTYYLNGQEKSEVNMTNGKENGLYLSYYFNGKPESAGWFVDGQYQGQWSFYDELGRLTGRSYYLDGDLDGYKEAFLPDGKKTSEEKYHTGWLEKLTQYDEAGNIMAVDSFPKGSGKYKLIYPGGKIMGEGNYTNGDFDGPYKTYFFDGSLETSAFYKKGLRDSIYTGYNYGGTKKIEGRYSSGNKTGMWRSYDEDGKLSGTSQYANDELNGEQISYLPNGSKDLVSVYKNDQLAGSEQKYDPEGALAYQIEFEDNIAKSFTYIGKDGKLVSPIPLADKNGLLKAYYPNGKLSRECGYSDGIKNGVNLIYYDNGQLRSMDTTAYGVGQGVSKEFYKDGKIKSVYRYIVDNADGNCLEYDSNGTLAKEIMYDDGAGNGPAKYYQNGKPVKTMIYHYGTLISVKNEK